MNTLTTWIGISLTCFSALSASAESLRCDSPQVRVAGNFNRTYVRMGKAALNGTFSIMLRDASNAVTVSQVRVIDGSTQDDRDLSFIDARDQQGRAVSLDLDLTASRMSSVRINNTVIPFFARCAWSNTPTAPAACQSSPTAGLDCSVINGSCVCHQHTTH